MNPGRRSSAAELATAIDAHQTTRLSWTTVAKRAVVVVVAGVALYLLLPSLTEVLGSWPRLSTLSPIWFAVAVAAELAHFGCTFALQRLALPTKGWFAVVTAQLAGNAVTNVLPAGGAVGAAVQYRMLLTAGIDPDAAVGGLTAFALLGVGGLLALPLFALPAILFGVPVQAGLLRESLIGVAGFVLFGALGVVVLAADRPLLVFGQALQRLRNAILHRRPPARGLGPRLLRERDVIRSVLGTKWRSAVLLSAGRLAFDYTCLLASVRATGSHPRPSLILLAYAITGAVALVPITPGALGVFEASLSGLLVVAGVSAGNALLATLTYRLASYWLPLLSGPVAYSLFRRRFGAPEPRRAAHVPPR